MSGAAAAAEGHSGRAEAEGDSAAAAGPGRAQGRAAAPDGGSGSGAAAAGTGGPGPLERGRFPAGQSALLVEFPAAERLVAHWRRRHDPSAAAGIPAHVTVLFPFLDAGADGRPGSVDDTVREELRTLFAAHPAFTVTFTALRRFPDVVYLAPEPAAPLQALTTAAVARWPDTQPYGGQFAEVVPHLTVAHSDDPELLAAAEAALAPHLPVTAEAAAVSLYVSDGERWHRRTSFPLGGASV